MLYVFAFVVLAAIASSVQAQSLNTTGTIPVTSQPTTCETMFGAADATGLIHVPGAALFAYSLTRKCVLTGCTVAGNRTIVVDMAGVGPRTQLILDSCDISGDVAVAFTSSTGTIAGLSVVVQNTVSQVTFGAWRTSPIVALLETALPLPPSGVPTASLFSIVAGKVTNSSIALLGSTFVVSSSVATADTVSVGCIHARSRVLNGALIADGATSVSAQGAGTVAVLSMWMYMDPADGGATLRSGAIDVVRGCSLSAVSTMVLSARATVSCFVAVASIVTTTPPPATGRAALSVTVNHPTIWIEGAAVSARHGGAGMSAVCMIVETAVFTTVFPTAASTSSTRVLSSLIFVSSSIVSADTVACAVSEVLIAGYAFAVGIALTWTSANVAGAVVVVTSHSVVTASAPFGAATGSIACSDSCSQFQIGQVIVQIDANATMTTSLSYQCSISAGALAASVYLSQSTGGPLLAQGGIALVAASLAIVAVTVQDALVGQVAAALTIGSYFSSGGVTAESAILPLSILIAVNAATVTIVNGGTHPAAVSIVSSQAGPVLITGPAARIVIIATNGSTVRVAAGGCGAAMSIAAIGVAGGASGSSVGGQATGVAVLSGVAVTIAAMGASTAVSMTAPNDAVAVMSIALQTLTSPVYNTAAVVVGDSNVTITASSGASVYVAAGVSGYAVAMANTMGSVSITGSSHATLAVYDDAGVSAQCAGDPQAIRAIPCRSIFVVSVVVTESPAAWIALQGRAALFVAVWSGGGATASAMTSPVGAVTVSATSGSIQFDASANATVAAWGAANIAVKFSLASTTNPADQAASTGVSIYASLVKALGVTTVTALDSAISGDGSTVAGVVMGLQSPPESCSMSCPAKLSVIACNTAFSGCDSRYLPMQQAVLSPAGYSLTLRVNPTSTRDRQKYCAAPQLVLPLPTPTDAVTLLIALYQITQSFVYGSGMSVYAPPTAAPTPAPSTSASTLSPAPTPAATSPYHSAAATTAPIARRQTKTISATLDVAQRALAQLHPEKVYCQTENSTSVCVPSAFGACCGTELAARSARLPDDPMGRCNNTLALCLALAKAPLGQRISFDDAAMAFIVVGGAASATCAEPLSTMLDCFEKYQDCVVGAALGYAGLYNSSSSDCAWYPATVASLRLTGAELGAGSPYNATVMYAQCIVGVRWSFQAIGCQPSSNATIAAAVTTRCGAPSATLLQYCGHAAAAHATSAGVSSNPAPAALGDGGSSVAPVVYHVGMRPFSDLCQRLYCAELNTVQGAMPCNCSAGYTASTFNGFHPLALQPETQFDPCYSEGFTFSLCTPPTATTALIATAASLTANLRKMSLLQSGPGATECTKGSATFRLDVVIASPSSGSLGSDALINTTFCVPTAVTMFVAMEAYPVQTPFTVERTECVGSRDWSATGLTVRCVCPAGVDVTTAPLVVQNTTTGALVAAVIALCNAQPQLRQPPDTGTTVTAAISALVSKPAGATLQAALLIDAVKCPPPRSLPPPSAYTASDIVNSPLRIGSEAAAPMYGHIVLHAGLALLSVVVVVARAGYHRRASDRLPEAYTQLAVSHSPFALHHASTVASVGEAPPYAAQDDYDDTAFQLDTESYHDRDVRRSSASDVLFTHVPHPPADEEMIETSHAHGDASAAPRPSMPGSDLSVLGVVLEESVMESGATWPRGDASETAAAAEAGDVHSTLSQSARRHSGASLIPTDRHKGPSDAPSGPEASTIADASSYPTVGGSVALLSEAVEGALWWTRLPNWYLRFVTFYFLGVASEAALLFLNGVTYGHSGYAALGGMMLALQVAYVVVAQAALLKRRVLIHRLEKIYVAELGALPSEAHVRFGALFTGRWRHGLPPTFWDTDEVMPRCFGELFTLGHGPYASTTISVRFITLLVTAFLVHAPATNVDQCRSIMVVLSVVFFAQAVLFAIVRPFRDPTETAFGVVNNIVAGLVPLSRAYTVASASTLQTALYVVTIVSAVVNVAVASLEWTVRRGIKQSQLPHGPESANHHGDNNGHVHDLFH